MTENGDDIVARLERIALMAEISNHHTPDGSMRLMPAEGVADVVYEAMGDIVDLRIEVEELRAEVLRLWNLVPHPEETDDERLLKDYKRGVPLLALSKERGSTRERIRHRLKKMGAIT